MPSDGLSTIEMSSDGLSTIDIVPFEPRFQAQVGAMFVDGLVSQGPYSLQKWFTTQKMEQDMGDIYKNYMDDENKKSHGGLMFFVALDREKDNRLAGFVGMMESTYGPYSTQELMYEGLPGGPADVCELVRMSVNPDYRRRGLGPRLVEAVEEKAKSMGFKRLAIGTLLSMKPAIRLYESCGATFVKNEVIDLTSRMGPIDPYTGKAWEEVKVYHCKKDLV